VITFERNEFTAPQASGDTINTACVEVAHRAGVVELRDSKVPFGSAADRRIRLSTMEFEAYLRAYRAGDTTGQALVITELAPGWYELRRSGSDVFLMFTAAEMNAFYEDIHLGRYEARLAA
jgi:hypothetical protein